MEREAVKRLFMQHYVRLHRVAQSLLLDGQESEDVVSDVFESLLCGRMELPAEGEVRYLLTCVRNRCLKRLRHMAIVRNSLLHSSAEEEEAADERLTDILEYVSTHFSERDKRIFHLRFTDGYSYEEIAARENISKVAVWKHLSHILSSITNQFNPTS